MVTFLQVMGHTRLLIQQTRMVPLTHFEFHIMTTPSNNNSDSISPSISIIRPTQSFTGEKLDRLKLNYKMWFEDADLFLTACGLSGYTDGTLPCSGINEHRAHSNWHSNDKLAAALLYSTIKKTE